MFIFQEIYGSREIAISSGYFLLTFDPDFIEQ